MKVLYIATECKPFSKVGGIGDVAGELPPALREQGVDIEIVIPWYGSTAVQDYTISCHDTQQIPSVVLPPHLRDVPRETPMGIIPSHLKGVPVTFVKSAAYFEGPYSKPYIDSRTIPFYDDALRFSFFSKACIQLIKDKRPDIVHVNDWSLAYLFAFMEMQRLPQKRVITVHNVGYQGNIWKPFIKGTGMEAIASDKELGPLFEDPRAEWNSVNALRLGLELCDCAHTVSPRYAEEMALPEDQGRYFEGGKGLEPVAKRLYEEGRLIGILNGFEYQRDPTPEAFGECLEAKRNRKSIIAKEFADPEGFLAAFVGRAAEQKLKLLVELLDGRPVLEHILDLSGVNITVLGTGLAEYEGFIRKYMGRRNYSASIEFNPQKSKDISLGCDLFLMPSLYEPCGIAQMESLSYATPPLVRWTGGLVNTVKAHTEADGTGFGFDGSTKREVLENLVKAVETARDMFAGNREAYRKLQERGFKERFLWKTSAKQYIEKIYEPVASGKLARK